MLRLIVMLAVAIAVIGGIHAYLWKRLVRDTMARGWPRRTGAVVAVLLGLLVPVTLIVTNTLGPAASRPVAWVGYTWLALMFYLLVFLLVLELPALVVKLVLRRRARAAVAVPAEPVMAAVGAGPGSAPPADLTDPTDPTDDSSGGEGADRAAAARRALLSRRQLLARGVAVTAGAAAVGLVGYGMATALGPPRLAAVTVPIRRLGAGLDGLRIAVVSDIHLGAILGRSHTERVVSTINEAEPDLVAIVGDLVDGSVEELGPAAAPLADLVSRHGSFFVTGNHEYYSGVGPWVAELERLGVNPLLNERIEIRDGGAVLDLAGVNDISAPADADGPDFDRALGRRDQSRPVVLLAHQPVQVHDAAEHGVDLQLSGHTHGGQMYPFHYLVRAAQPSLAGLSRHQDTALYVTRGTGFWGPPVRIGAPPEISIVQLRAGQG